MALSKLSVRRLTKLADYMDSLPRSAARHFNMRSFIEHSGDHKHEISDSPTVKELHTCGTSACALGWACTMPYFKRLGLTLDTLGSDLDEKLFGIECEQWEDLFECENNDKTPKAWAKRCRKYIRENS